MLRRLSLVICVCLVTLLSASDAAVQAAGRAALVIGNGEYLYSKSLTNPINDANDMADLLEVLGFKVIKLINGDFGKIRSAVRSFNTLVEKSDIGLIYYAGHGMELGGDNWLIPVDAELRTDLDLTGEAINLKMILQSVSRARELGLVILDSCRDNPFAAKMVRSKMTRSVDRGLARLEPTPNVLVAYAAKDGTTATDGDGRNSPYTAALLKYMPTRGLEVSFIFRKVRDDVMTATNKKQQPFVYGSLSSKAIYFNEPPVAAAPPVVEPAPPPAPAPVAPPAPAPVAAPAPPPAPPVNRVEQTVWAAIRESSDEKLFDSFLAQFPASSHVSEAKGRLEALRSGSECDQLSASILRGGRDRKAGGGEPAQAEPVSAKRACDNAVARSPDVVRYAFQGGRAAEVAQDYVGARTLYEKAANLGNGPSMVSLGMLLETERGGPRNYAKARALYEKAELAGETQAPTRIGKLYETGHGVRQSYAQAHYWYKKAAKLEDAESMERLAVLYERGLGVKKNAQEAKIWRGKAESAKTRPAPSIPTRERKAGAIVPQ